MSHRRDGARFSLGRRLRLSVAALTTSLSVAGAANAADPEPLYTNNPRFRIPFQFDAEEMTRIGAVEVQLQVSTNQGGSWSVVETVSPAAQKFTFQAPGDGDYWFSVRTIDLQGEPHPAGALTPGLRVVVDEADPVLTLNVAPTAPGRLQLNWQAIDDNLAADTLRLEYLDESSGAWQPVSASGPNGRADWSVEFGGTVLVRGTVSDRAGNSASASGSAQVSPPVAAGSQSAPETRQDRPDLREPVADFSQPGNDINLFNTSASSPGLPVILPNMPHAPVPMYASTSQVGGLESYPGPSAPQRPMLPQEAAAPTVSAMASSPSAVAGPLDTARRVNSRSFRIGYEVQEVGPSGVGSVDLYITEDAGRRWFHYGSDPDRNSPFDVLAPRDGVYGFAIRVRNGIGIVGNPPQPGEPPEIVVVVDQTAPMARLTAVQQASVNGVHQVQIAWFAQDDHLAGRPIALLEGPSATGPWTPITGWMENSGQYLWSANPLAPRNIYVRLEVRDAAGNINAAVSDRPLLLDGSRPSARILDVESVQPIGSLR